MSGQWMMPQYSHVTLSLNSFVSPIWFMLRIAIMNNHSLNFLLRAQTLHILINPIALTLDIRP